MNNKKITYAVIAMLLCMIAVIACFLFVNDKSVNEKVGFYDEKNDITYHLYQNDTDGKYYLFLPSYLSADEVEVVCDEGEVSFSDENGNFDSSIENVPTGSDCKMLLTNGNKSEEYTVVINQCKNLPSVCIETKSGNMQNVNSGKTHDEDIAAIFLDESGNVKLSESATVSGRGNSTWEWDKKPYTLSFTKPVSVGEFNEVKKLCLLAEYSDESRMRNAIASHAAQEFDFDYATPYTYVDLFANGEYLGLYGIVTKDSYLSDVDSGIKGVFEIAVTKNTHEFKSDFGWRINVLYGDVNEVKGYVSDLEGALSARDFEKCAKLADLHAFALSYAYEEFLVNWDIAGPSKYYYIDKDDVIHPMMPWDHDWALGAASNFFNSSAVNEIMIDRHYARSDAYYAIMLEDESFRSDVLDILDKSFSAAFINDLTNFTSDTAELIEQSRNCDLIRWKDGTPASEFDTASGMQTTAEFAEYFNDFYYARKEFLKSYYSSPDDYVSVFFASKYDTYFKIYIPKGAKLFDYVSRDDGIFRMESEKVKLLDWKTKEGVSVFDFNTVDEDTVFNGEFDDSTNETLDKIVKYKTDLAITACLGLTFLVLVIIEIVRIKKDKAGGRNE